MTQIDVESPFGRYVDVIDLATGEVLKKIRWANDQTGEYGQYVDGVLVVKRGRIKIRFDGPANLYNYFVQRHGE